MLAIKFRSFRAGNILVDILTIDTADGGFGEGACLLKPLEGFSLFPGASALVIVGLVGGKGAIDGGVNTGLAQGRAQSWPSEAEGLLKLDEAPGELTLGG